MQIYQKCPNQTNHPWSGYSQGRETFLAPYIFRYTKMKQEAHFHYQSVLDADDIEQPIEKSKMESISNVKKKVYLT